MSIPPALSGLLRASLPASPILVAQDEEKRLPPAPGTYVLLLLLRAPLALSGRFAERTLAPGWYAYVGSARGPGGLKARLSRHLRREKTLRWHVDRLTTRAAECWALPFPDGPETRAITAQSLTECALARYLLATGRFGHPLPGFGSSDCKSCESHLLMWHSPQSSP